MERRKFFKGLLGLAALPLVAKVELPKVEPPKPPPTKGYMRVWLNGTATTSVPNFVWVEI